MGAFVVGVITAVYRPWEMAHRLPRNIADPSFVTWTLAWGARAIRTSPLHWYEAPIFWPHKATLAYSDPGMGLAPVYGVLHAVTGSWTVSVGAIVIALVVTNFLATYALARRLSGRADAALVAATSFALSDFALSQWGHIQLQTIGFLSIAFLLLLRVLERGRIADAFLLAVVQIFLALTVGAVAAAWAVAAVTAVVVYVLRVRGRVPGAVVRALVFSVVATALVVVPATRPYARLERDPGFRRPLEARLVLTDLLRPAHRSAIVPRLRRKSGEHEYFPGATALALAVVGLGAVWPGKRRRRGAGDQPTSEIRRDEAALVVAAGVVCLLVAMGPTIAGLPGPFRLLHDHVPGFRAIRVASRFATVTLLAIAVLAACGFATLVRRLRRPVARGAAAVVVLGALLVELAIPVKWKTLPSDAATLAVYRDLRRRPAGAVVELPIADWRDPVAWSTFEGPRLVYASIDWHPRFNGYSGYAPPAYGDEAAVLNELPERCALVLARQLGIRYAIFHREVAARAAYVPPEAVTRHGPDRLVDLSKVPRAGGSLAACASPS